MNTPNKLTVLRMILAPVFLAVLLAERLPYHFWWAVFVFSVAAITDAIDGRLARKNGQITVFGKLLDPVADKMLTTAALLGFMQDKEGKVISATTGYEDGAIDTLMKQIDKALK